MMDINIGDIVEVISQDDKPWTWDWRERFVVVGINAKRGLQYDISTLDYTVVQVGHPEDGGTDGFSAEDLRVVTAANQPPALAVAVEVSAPEWGKGTRQFHGLMQVIPAIGPYYARDEHWYLDEYYMGIGGKMAAEAHRRDAILSAINARPVSAVKAEALRERNDQIMAAAIQEYHMHDNLAGQREHAARRAAVRGLMVRLGLYGKFCAEADHLDPPKEG